MNSRRREPSMSLLFGVKWNRTVWMCPRHQLLRRDLNGWRPARAVRVWRFCARCRPGTAGFQCTSLGPCDTGMFLLIITRY